MAMWRYNEVVLPELPEYDDSIYPYAALVQPFTSTENMGNPILVLFSSDVEFYYDNAVRIAVYSQCSWRWNTDGVTWDDGDGPTMNDDGSDVRTNIVCPAGIEELAYVGFRTVWSNFDIYWEDGSEYLTASDPVVLFPTKDWLIGHVIGRASKPIPMGGSDDGL